MGNAETVAARAAKMLSALTAEERRAAAMPRKRSGTSARTAGEVCSACPWLCFLAGYFVCISIVMNSALPKPVNAASRTFAPFINIQYRKCEPLRSSINIRDAKSEP